MGYNTKYINNGTIDLRELLHLDYVSDMVSTIQDPIWHAEGNVFIHTQMVIDSLHGLKEFNELEENEKEIVLLSALFHDVEKRSTTTTELIDGIERIVAPSHARKGESTTRLILYSETNLSHEVREEICKIIRYHTKPVHLTEEYDVIKIASECKIKLLCILAKADILGRTCPDADSLIDNIDYFALVAKELDCYDKEFSFKNDLQRFKYLNKESESYLYEPFDNTRSRAILMSGIAGSGKDYWIEKSSIKNVISLDDMRRARKIKHGDKKGNGQIIQEAKEMARVYLRNGDDFIWNGTNITRDMRRVIISLFLEYNALVEILYIEPNLDLLVSQNKNREYPIPYKDQLKMISKLEVPTKCEAHILTKIIRNV